MRVERPGSAAHRQANRHVGPGPETRGGFRLSATLLLPVLAAAAALFWIVPEWPLGHLDDPSHWGIVGYAVVVVALVARTVRGRPAFRRRTMAVFLVAMPVVYLADWARFGGSAGWLAVEAAGAVLYWGLAWMGTVRWIWVLPVGIAGHGLWDLAHLGPVAPFVPDWYALACVVVDGALGASLAAAIALRPGPRPTPRTTPQESGC